MTVSLRLLYQINITNCTIRLLLFLFFYFSYSTVNNAAQGNWGFGCWYYKKLSNCPGGKLQGNLMMANWLWNWPIDITLQIIFYSCILKQCLDILHFFSLVLSNRSLFENTKPFINGLSSVKQPITAADMSSVLRAATLFSEVMWSASCCLSPDYTNFYSSSFSAEWITNDVHVCMKRNSIYCK